MRPAHAHFQTSFCRAARSVFDATVAVAPLQRNRGFRLSSALVLGTLIPLLALADPVGASFPGRNGLIAFVLDADNTSALWVANADGTHQRRLAAMGGDQSSPAFSASGRSIAFTATVRREPQIFVIKPDGSGKRRLTDRPSGAADPSFSRDGRKVVFDSHGALFVMNADGSHQRLIARDAVMPSFSPDGSRIAFSRPGRRGIWTMNGDGSHQKAITAGSSDAGYTFSPTAAESSSRAKGRERKLPTTSSS
jgi:Tol biopolymer transport system component